MLRENGNKEAEFDVSKLTVFCVNIYSNEEKTTQKTTQTLSEIQMAVIKYIIYNKGIQVPVVKKSRRIFSKKHGRYIGLFA